VLFYPSVTCNLTLRFDETLEVATVPAAPAANAQEGVVPGQTAEDPAPGTRESEPGDARPGDSIDDITAVTDAILEPLVLPKDDPFTQILARIPVKGSWELPGIRQAGKFNLTFDFRDMPIDPRVLRAVAVEIHVGAVSAENFAAGMGGAVDANEQRLSVLRQKRSEVAKNLGSQILVGTADRVHVRHGSKGSTITLVGRDLRGILLDAKIPVKKIRQVDLTKPIHEVVAAILATITTDDTFLVDVSTDEREWPNGLVPSPADAKGLTRVRRGADGGGANSTPAGGSEISYWDLITQYCSLVGGTPHFVGTVLWIRPAHSIFKRVLDETIPTPFADAGPRQVGAEQLRVRRLVYGRELDNLEFERSFGGQNVPLIKAISIDDTKRGMEKLLIAQWPPKGSDAAKLKADNEVLRIPVPGVKSLEQLEQVARELYEEIGRGEIGGKASTKNLASFGGDNSDPDMVRLRPTDAVELLTDVRALSSNAPLVSELNQHEQRSFEEEVAHLNARLGDPVFARVLVAISRGAIARSLNFFRVYNVRYTWALSTGIAIDFDFQNYVIARHEVVADAETAEQPRVRTKRVKRRAKLNKRPEPGSARDRLGRRYEAAAKTIAEAEFNDFERKQLREAASFGSPRNRFIRRLISQGFDRETAESVARTAFR
jgi:hypothetical protein